MTCLFWEVDFHHHLMGETKLAEQNKLEKSSITKMQCQIKKNKQTKKNPIKPFLLRGALILIPQMLLRLSMRKYQED